MRRSVLRQHTASQVIVALTNDSSVGGWLEEVGKDGYLLRAPHLLLEEGVQPLDGELYIPREKVLFVQVGGAWKS